MSRLDEERAPRPSPPPDRLARTVPRASQTGPTLLTRTGGHPVGDRPRPARFGPRLIGGEGQFALPFEAVPGTPAGDAVTRGAGAAGQLATAGTHPLDGPDHQLTRAHTVNLLSAGSRRQAPDASLPQPSKQNVESALMATMDAIDPIDTRRCSSRAALARRDGSSQSGPRGAPQPRGRGLTGSGNHGAIACHSGASSTSSTGVSWARWICEATANCVASWPGQKVTV